MGNIMSGTYILSLVQSGKLIRRIECDVLPPIGSKLTLSFLVDSKMEEMKYSETNDDTIYLVRDLNIICRYRTEGTKEYFRGMEYEVTVEDITP